MKPIDVRSALGTVSWILFVAAFAVPIVAWLSIPKALPPSNERAEAAQQIFSSSYIEAAISVLAFGFSVAAWRLKKRWPMWRSIAAAVFGGIATYYLLMLAVVRSLNFG